MKVYRKVILIFVPLPLNTYTWLHLDVCIAPAFAPTYPVKRRPDWCGLGNLSDWRRLGRARLFFTSCVCQFCDGGIEALNRLLAITRCHRRYNCCSLSKTKQFSTSQEKFNRIFYSHHRENFKIYLPWGCWRTTERRNADKLKKSLNQKSQSVLVNFNKALIKSSKTSNL